MKQREMKVDSVTQEPELMRYFWVTWKHTDPILNTILSSEIIEVSYNEPINAETFSEILSKYPTKVYPNDIVAWSEIEGE